MIDRYNVKKLTIFPTDLWILSIKRSISKVIRYLEAKP